MLSGLFTELMTGHKHKLYENNIVVYSSFQVIFYDLVKINISAPRPTVLNGRCSKTETERTPKERKWFEFSNICFKSAWGFVLLQLLYGGRLSFRRILREFLLPFTCLLFQSQSDYGIRRAKIKRKIRGEGHSKKFYTGRLRPEVQTLTLLNTILLYLP